MTQKAESLEFRAESRSGVAIHRMVPGRSIPLLRMIVANDRRRIDELSAAMESEFGELPLSHGSGRATDPVPGAPGIGTAWLVLCEQAEALLQHSQRLLAAYLLASENSTPSPVPETTLHRS